MNIHFVKHLKPAKRYAHALCELTGDFSKEEILENLKFVLETIKANEELETFLDSPVISKADKKDVIGQIFIKHVPNPVINFLNLLVDNNKLKIFECVIECLEEDINEINNVLKVQISSAISLSDINKEKIKSKLEEKFNKTIQPEFITDEGVLGGLIIKINDTVIDLSLRKKINNLKNLIER